MRAGHVFLQDGPLRLALRPLNLAVHGEVEAIRIEPVENYQVISFYNYAGPARTFTADELAGMLNGFVSVIGLTAEESYDKFVERVTAAKCADYWYFKLRTVRYQLAGTLLEMGYATESDRVRLRASTGARCQDRSGKRMVCRRNGCRFFQGRPITNTLEIPFQHLRRGLGAGCALDHRI